MRIHENQRKLSKKELDCWNDQNERNEKGTKQEYERSMKTFGQLTRRSYVA